MVTAYNSVGNGELANTTVITQQKAPGGPPTKLTTQRLNARNITLSWFPPLEPNGILTYQLVLFDKGKLV